MHVDLATSWKVHVGLLHAQGCFWLRQPIFPVVTMIADQAAARNQGCARFAELQPYAGMRGASEGRVAAVTSNDDDIDVDEL